MLIPLGILAGSGGVADSYDLIATEILTSNQASITFSSLGTYSSTYKHLQIRYASRITENVGGAGTFYINLNADTGSNYARHALRGNGSTVTSIGASSMSTPDIGYTAGSESAANIFGAGVVEILDPYATKNKTLRTFSGLVSGSKELAIHSVLWNNTASLTTLTFETFGADSFVTGTRFSLYGIRG
jgi:hypothetical protein